MKREQRIEEGDEVKVFPTDSSEFAYSGVVQHMPQATGDSWRIVCRDGTVVYQQSFNRMVLMSKGPEDGPLLSHDCTAHMACKVCGCLPVRSYRDVYGSDI